MKTGLKHIICTFLLILALIISAPVRSLHECNNLAHHHNEVTIENNHSDCSICDININSTEHDIDPIEFIHADNVSVFSAGALPHFYSVNATHQYLRGPPSF